MTIRRQLTFSYLGILILLGSNLLIYLWTDTKRQAAFEDLRRAISRQTLISSIERQLGDFQKQVTLLSQITGAGGLQRAFAGRDQDQFNSRLDSIGQEIQQVAALTRHAATRRTSNRSTSAFEELSASWRVFYQNLGQNRGITEMVLHAEPLARDVSCRSMLPAFTGSREEPAGRGAAHFHDVTTSGGPDHAGGFPVSAALLAGVLAILVSERLQRGLHVLKTGADALGCRQPGTSHSGAQQG